MQAKREAHINELANNYGVTIEWQPTWPSEIGCIRWKTMVMILPPCRDKVAYMAALHELGHVAMGHAGVAASVSRWDGDEEQVVQAEREAWKWAYRESKEPIGIPTRNRCLRLLASYDPSLRTVVKPLYVNEDFGDDWLENFGYALGF